ncbi:MAG: helix-turn-helix domain-containing protein [Puniceicoccaceae bacterium]
MTVLIRQTFEERIRRSEVLARVLGDLSRVCGLTVNFFSQTQAEAFLPPCHGLSPLCRDLNRMETGRRLCEDARRHMLEETRSRTVEHTCVAGTLVCATPITSSVGLLGFLVAGGFHGAPPDQRALNRVRHLLERKGIFVPPERMAETAAGTPVWEEDRRESFRRVLEMAAGYLVKELSLELFDEGRDLPESIRRACRLIQERFQGDPAQEEIARAVGLSAGHFSRLFHRRTGLRYSEYLNEVRLRYVRRELRERDAPITRIAMDAGFRSLSQFNRRFKSHYGVSPRDYRKRYRSGTPVGQGCGPPAKPGR